MIFVLDNYDSFTYNLVQMAGRFSGTIVVYRNDKISVSEVEQLTPDGILISPGPGRPEHAGITMELIKTLAHKIPILGVCLGHQAIGAVFGGRVTHAPELVHGKTSSIRHNGKGIFKDVQNPFDAGRYHSLVVDKGNISDVLEITAQTDEGLVMALQHKTLPVTGVQFHPESILTPVGERILENWIGGL